MHSKGILLHTDDGELFNFPRIYCVSSSSVFNNKDFTRLSIVLDNFFLLLSKINGQISLFVLLF